jgi:2-dehydropantoate 2-reductase
MDNSGLKFLVIGAGAVGGITAALLKKNGQNVEIVCKYDEYARLISETGIEVSGVCGDLKIKMPAYASLSEVKEEKDIVILATKANEMLEAAGSIGSILRKNGYIISMQNGICEDDLSAVIGKERVIGCVTGWGATMTSKGKLVMTSKGDFIIGYVAKKSDEFLTGIAEILSTVVPARTTNNIAGHKYSKLIINSCITSLGAICGMYLGKMLMSRKVRNIFIEIIREALAVSSKMKLKIEIFGGRLDFSKFVEGSGFLPDLQRHALLLVIGFKYRKLKSSSLQSLERGKQTEIDYLNGYIVSNAEKFGISVPVNRVIVNMIHQIEQKERDISFSNFDDPFFNRFR